MSFGGEYLFPEKWKIINDTPDDGQLSKTEKIRRGEVSFHRKTFVDDDWKYHHGRARQVRPGRTINSPPTHTHTHTTTHTRTPPTS